MDQTRWMRDNEYDFESGCQGEIRDLFEEFLEESDEDYVELSERCLDRRTRFARTCSREEGEALYAALNDFFGPLIRQNPSSHTIKSFSSLRNGIEEEYGL